MRNKFAGYYRNNACFRTQGDGPERIRIKTLPYLYFIPIMTD